LETWYLGLPAPSSHTLIGSIIGVGVANALVHGQNGTSGVDWDQATAVGKALLFSPVVGLMAADGSGLQASTLRNIALAWVLTLPMAMMLSGGLYILFLHLF
jgi:phosphate/sulfate permease